MIMRPGQQLLLPANPFFIWGSLIGALMLNMSQNMGMLGRAAWSPDLLAVVLVFWTVHQPLRVSIGGAFVLLLITGRALSMPTMIGLIMLMGIVTKKLYFVGGLRGAGTPGRHGAF